MGWGGCWGVGNPSFETSDTLMLDDPSRSGTINLASKSARLGRNHEPA